MTPPATQDDSAAIDADPPRSALITGASRGIGLEIARRLAGQGYRLTISARRMEGLVDAAAELRAAGAEVHPVAANLAHHDEVNAIVDQHADRYQTMNLLVLNAGVGAAGTVAETSLKNYDLMLGVNLKSQFLLVQSALPLLRKAAARNPAAGARIVALSSITGLAAEAGLSIYGASKAALISLCESVSLEESANGVSATAICPGYVATDMSAHMYDDIDPASMLAVSDIAELVVALSRLSALAVVPSIVISRAGPVIWRA